MCGFCIETHKVFGSLTQNCVQLDKDEYIVSTFLAFLVDKNAVKTTRKSSYVECFNFGQQGVVFAYPFLDILIKSTKLHLQS